MADIENTLVKQISDVVGTAKNPDYKQDLVNNLADDVLMFESWYGSDSPSIDVNYGTPIHDLTPDEKSKLLAKTIRRYVIDNSGNRTNADEVTRLSMDKIMNWEKWYPDWYGDQNFHSYNEEDEADSLAYTGPYGEDGDNGIGDYF